MPTPTAQTLLLEAQNHSRKLTTRERRHVITWLQATSGLDQEQVAMTNQQLADLFGVTERTIRQDKQAFRKEKAKFIREDDVSLIIADIAMDFERQLRDIEKSKAKATLGTATYLKHCVEAMSLRVQMVSSLQDLGYYPKNLGQLTVTKWDFQSTVDSTTGYVITDQLRPGEELPTLEGTIVTPGQLGDGNAEATIRSNEFSQETDSSDTCTIEITTGPS